MEAPPIITATTPVTQPTRVLGILGIVLGLIFPIVGFILGICSIIKKEPQHVGAIALIMSGLAWIVWTFCLMCS